MSEPSTVAPGTYMPAPLPGDPTDLCPLCGLPAVAELVLALGELLEVAKAGQANVKSERGTSYTYRYLELPDLLTEARRVLSAHHVAIMQEVTNAERDVTVVTVLLHASGREFRSPPLTLRSGGGPQDIGSASTYGRRYSLASYVGLAGDVDDDGQAAKRPTKAADQPPPGPTVEGPPDDPAQVDHRGGSVRQGTASEQSIKLLWKLLRDTGMDNAQIRRWGAAVLQIGDDWSTKDLSQAQVSGLIDRLKAETGEQ